MRKLNFTKIRIPVDFQEVVRAAVARITLLSGKEFQVVNFMFGKVLACDFEDLLLVRLTTFSRPPVGTVVAIKKDSNKRFYIPAYIEEDFQELCELLGGYLNQEKDELRKVFQVRKSDPRR